MIFQHNLWSLHLLTLTFRWELKLSGKKGLGRGCCHSNSHVCLWRYSQEALCWEVQSVHLIQLVTQALHVLLCPKMPLNCHVFNRKVKTDILLNIYLINKHKIITAFYFELAFPSGFSAHSMDVLFPPDGRELNYRSTTELLLCMKVKQMKLLPLPPKGCCYEEIQLNMTVLC